MLMKLVTYNCDVYWDGLMDAERLVSAVDRCSDYLYHLQTQSLVMNLQLHMSYILT
jgi:hypothetical protein